MCKFTSVATMKENVYVVLTFTFTYLKIIRTFVHRSNKGSKTLKVFTSTPKPRSFNNPTCEADDVQMALGLSISTESLRRESRGFISTQEYIEDESRRSSMLRERESVVISKDMFATTEVQEEEEEEEEDVAEGETEWNVEDQEMPCFSQFRQAGSATEQLDETRRARWCGDEKVEMVESTSHFVGQPVKPSVVVQSSRQSVGECSLRLIRSMNDGIESIKPSATTIKACQDAQIKIGILNEPDLPQHVPFNLQYLGCRKIENDQLVVKVSDGVNHREFFVSEKFAFMFDEGKIATNSILKMLKLKKKDGHLVVRNIVVAPMGRKMLQIGDPK